MNEKNKFTSMLYSSIATMFFVGFLLGGFNDEPFSIFSFIFNSFGFALTCGVPLLVFAIIDFFVSEYEEIANKTATQLIVILIAVFILFFV